MLDENAARWVLVLHTALGVAAVGASTHLVLWLRKYVRGETGRRRAVVRFAWLVLALQLAAFVAGNVMYPTYKVEVRAAYLENPPAIMAAHHGEATVDLVRRSAEAARWFDMKEHWVALGIPISAALVLVLSLWDPDEGKAIGPIVVMLVVIANATLWLAAIAGVLTASIRAV